MEPRVTVVIPARNERDAIVPCLESLQRQTERRVQIIVVDGGSEDGTSDVVRELAKDDDRIELLDNPDRTVPFALNRALEAARAPLLVRVDAHATVPTGYVAKAAELLESGRWGGVGGIKRGVGRTPAGRAISAAMSSPFGVGGSVYHYGTHPQEVDHVPFGAYPVALARALGGWGEEFTVNQDFEFDYRIRAAGNRILFDPALVIDWECRQSLRALARQYRRYGKGKVKVAARHPRSLRARHVIPPALVAWLTAALVVSVGSRRGLQVAIPAVAPYVVVLAVATLTSPALPDRPARPFLPAAFAVMHVSWGIGFWEGLLEQIGRARR
jgi:glycosyltransferase involved in cell wall biosynthesis